MKSIGEIFAILNNKYILVQFKDKPSDTKENILVYSVYPINNKNYKYSIDKIIFPKCFINLIYPQENNIYLAKISKRYDADINNSDNSFNLIKGLMGIEQGIKFGIKNKDHPLPLVNYSENLNIEINEYISVGDKISYIL